MRPRTAAFTLASVLAIGLAADILWMPVQVSDSLDEILDARSSPSAVASFTDSLQSDDKHLRPFRVAQTKALFDVARYLPAVAVGEQAGDRYWLVYRGFHAALMVAAVLLFTVAQRVSTSTDAAASAFALVVFIGSRTFRGNVQEAFPINHFLEVVVLCLVSVNLARSRGGWWADAGAVLAFCVAALTLESGLLVWVVAVGAWLVGWRGISLGGLGVMTLMLAGYACLQLVYVDAGVPALPDRSTGFLFAVLDPSALHARFGDHPGVLYAYNIAASVSAVLFAEPSNGVFVAVRAWLSGDLSPRLVIPIATSIVTTVVIIWSAVRHLRDRLRFDDDVRFIGLFAIVLAANAAVSYSYTKDEILGVAGAFYALAAFAAARAALQVVERRGTSLPSVRSRVAVPALLVVLAATTVGWTVRAGGMHYLMRAQAFRHQNDWVQTPGAWRRDGRWPEDRGSQELLGQLHDAAIHLEVPNPRVGPRWVERTWED